MSEDYHVPRCFFDPTGTLVVGNSEDDVIYVWEAGGGMSGRGSLGRVTDTRERSGI